LFAHATNFILSSPKMKQILLLRKKRVFGFVGWLNSSFHGQKILRTHTHTHTHTHTLSDSNSTELLITTTPQLIEITMVRKLLRSKALNKRKMLKCNIIDARC